MKQRNLKVLLLFIALLSQTIMFAQERVIKGVVTEGANGQPIVGVTVFAKGANGRGTTTNNVGQYSINVPSGIDSLAFSFIGMSPVVEFIGVRGIINVSMSEFSRQVEEVFVTALGVKRQERNLGYSVSQLKSDEISTNKTINVQSSIMGKVAGVDISEAANGLAGSKRVVIRGVSTISTTGNSSPLWVVDGVPISSSNFGRNNDAGGGIDFGDGLSTINPDDIESISVLKGNAAAALYGSRASNGVIIITTKSAKSANKDFVAELNSTVNSTRIVDLTNWQYEYGQGRNGLRPIDQQEALVTGASTWGAKLDGQPSFQFDGEQRPYSAQKNNMNDFYSDALLFSNTFSISKSTDKHNFRLSVGQTDSRDFVESGRYKKRNAQVNASTSLGKFTANLTSMYMIEDVKNRQYIGGNVHNANYTLVNIPSSVNVLNMKPGYNPDGTELIFVDGAMTNPYFVIDKLYEGDTKNRLINSLGLRFDATKSVFAQMKVMQDYYFFKRLDYQPEGMNWQPFGGEINQRWSDFQELNYEFTTGYNHDLGKKIHTNIILGANVMKRKSENEYINGTPFVIPGIHTINNTVTRTATTGLSESQTNSLFGMAEFGYDKLLFLTLTGREDWFSTLPITSNHLFYPSASASFVFTDALKLPEKVISYGKLRASFAQVSGGADPYSLDLSYGLDTRNYNGQVLQGISTTTIPNKYLKPLISSESEFGMDARILNGLIYFDVAYYSKKVTDDIVSINVSNASGFNKAIMNTGKINNSGIEVMAEIKPIDQRFKWIATVVFSKNYNKVISLGDISSIQIGAAKNDVVTVNIEEDQPYGVIKGSVYLRDDNGNIVFDSTGLPMVGDKSTIIGKGYHDKIAGLTNRFDFDNFSFKFLIDGKFGGQLYSQTNRWATSAGKHEMTLAGRENGIIGKGVKEDGSVNDILVPAENLSSYYSRIATIHETFIYDASFVKLREVSLTYRLPKTLLRKMPISNASVSCVARNLFYLVNHVDNVSPESNVSSSNVQGLENSGYPESRSIGFNLNLTF